MIELEGNALVIDVVFNGYFDAVETVDYALATCLLQVDLWDNGVVN